MKSIRQNLQTPALPDFRNPGVQLRLLLAVNLLALVGAFVREDDAVRAMVAFQTWAAWGEPALLLTGLGLGAATPWLQRLPAAQGYLLAMGSMVLWGVLAAAWAREATLLPETVSLLRVAFLAVLVAVVVLGYFHLRAQALPGALAEARVQALAARIRPHFLFNSLNAALGLVRQSPRQAETVLESLADLFRALLADPRALVPLAEEVDRVKQYLEIERLRLGEDRLAVNWQVDVPEGIIVPVLLLQPLVENAVYHGIEPRAEGGEIDLSLKARDGRLLITLSNPVPEAGSRKHREGNHMALANIRERLLLHYDLSARLDSGERDGSYEVRIDLPAKGER